MHKAFHKLFDMFDPVLEAQVPKPTNEDDFVKAVKKDAKRYWRIRSLRNFFATHEIVEKRPKPKLVG